MSNINANSRRYYQKHRDEIRARAREKYRNNLEEQREYFRARYARNREAIRIYTKPRERQAYPRRLARAKATLIAMYGFKCRMCGTEDPRVLTINHKDNYGHKVRLASIRLAQQPKNNNLELLCWNCQRIYEYETGRIDSEVIKLVQIYIQEWTG